MQNYDITEIEARLRADLAEVAHQDDLGASGQKTVTLDQQAVGRLSRMDALQGQAMAQATAARRNAQVARIQSALERITCGEYGYCTECGDDIALARLNVDPTVPLCLTCAKGP